MAKPIIVDTHEKLTLKIFRGHRLHLIEHILCSPSDGWMLRGVVFVTYNEITGQRSGTEFPISSIPTSLRRFDVNRFTLGCHFTKDFLDRGVNLLENPPIEITNYSTTSREGYMEINYAVYRRLVDMVSLYGY